MVTNRWDLVRTPAGLKIKRRTLRLVDGSEPARQLRAPRCRRGNALNQGDGSSASLSSLPDLIRQSMRRLRVQDESAWTTRGDEVRLRNTPLAVAALLQVEGEFTKRPPLQGPR